MGFHLPRQEDWSSATAENLLPPHMDLCAAGSLPPSSRPWGKVLGNIMGLRQKSTKNIFLANSEDYFCELEVGLFPFNGPSLLFSVVPREEAQELGRVSCSHWAG